MESSRHELMGRIAVAVLDSLLEGDPIISIIISPQSLEITWER